MVAPGFIDIHSHSDLVYDTCPTAESKVRQGVTTEVVGMCGFSPGPVAPAREELVRDWMGGIGIKPRITWHTFGEYLDHLRALGPSVNVVQFVGHGALRLATVGADNRPPTPDEQRDMERLLAEAMDAGAFGYSTGLVYAPSVYAATEELIALARSMAGAGASTSPTCAARRRRSSPRTSRPSGSARRAACPCRSPTSRPPAARTGERWSARSG